MDLNEEEKAICEQAISFARKNKKLVALEITDLAIYPAYSGRRTGRVLNGGKRP